jgi:predicted Zn-dependent peptidase
VFRELYSEKRVVAEERRSRIDNSPMGRFQEAFLGAAITNNYRRPIIGYELDVEGLGRREVEAFFRERYGPSNMVICIVGDVMPEKVPCILQQPSTLSFCSATYLVVYCPVQPSPDLALSLTSQGWIENKQH